MIEEQIIKLVEPSIEKIQKEGLNTNNLELLYKLTKIRHLAKEDKEMYGNYEGRRPGYDTYGYDSYNRSYNNYNARGRDMRYRGDEHLERMRDEYGRYQESRSRYGAGEETDKSYHYMLEAVKDFIRVLYEEADTPQQKEMLRQTLQSSMM